MIHRLRRFHGFCANPLHNLPAFVSVSSVFSVVSPFFQGPNRLRHIENCSSGAKPSG